MASVIRLLPKRKVERKCVPYAALLDNVMRKRFLQAALILTYINAVAVIVTAVTIPSALSLGRVFALFLSSVSILLMQKVAFQTERVVHPSAIEEFFSKLTSLRTYVVLLSFWFSGYLYRVSSLSPRLQVYTVEHAEPEALPQGIPESLAIHRTIYWCVINENFLYYLTSIMMLSSVVAVRYVASDSNVLQLRLEENGVKPSMRLRSRLRQCVKPAIISWFISAVITNVFYFLLRRRTADIVARLFITRSAGETVLLSGFKPRYLLLPVFSILLSLTWYAAFEIFGAYMSLGPLFRGKPISDSAPFDKNGSLIDGLNRNPSQLCALTAWNEVLIIAEHDTRRRKSIFSDVDGDRVIWEQIHASFTKLITDQIEVLTPPKNDKNSKNASVTRDVTPKEDNNGPHAGSLTNTAAILQHPTSTAPGVDDHKVKVHHLTPTNLYKPESAFEKKVAKLTRSLESQSSSRAQIARKKLMKYWQTLLSGLEKVKIAALRTRVGSVFRRSVDRNLAIQLKHPQTTAFALRGIARMITKSATEDELGYVQGTIMPTLASIDSLADLLESVISHPSVHSSDVFVKGGEERPNVTRAIRLVGEVNGAFAEILEVFHPFLDNLGATPAVRKRAKRLSAGELNIEKTAWLST